MVIMLIMINVLTLMNKKLFITLFLLIPVFCMGMSKNKIVSVDRNGKVKGCTSFIAENDSTFLIDSIRYKLIKNHLEVTDCIKKENCSKIKFVYSLNFKGKKYNVTSIGNYVFLFDYILNELEIHKGITCIKPYAFNNCSIQEKIKVDRDNQFYDSRNNCNALIETKTNTLIIGCGNTIIPSDIQRIEQNAFLGNKVLRKIKIPKSVKSIGSLAFHKCYNLTKVELPEGLTSLEEGVFQECLSLSDIQIPQSVTTIGAWAFSGCNLESIVLPKGLKRIEGVAFISCKKLKNIILPQSVTYIGKGAFSYCKSLKRVEVSPYSEIGNSGVKAEISETSEPEDSLVNYRAFAYCDSLEKVTLPDGIKEIGSECFLMDNRLRRIFIPNSVEILGITAFCPCESLENIKLSENLHVVRFGAFGNCIKIKRIIIPNKVTTLEGKIFGGCINLEEVKLPASLTNIGEKIFYKTPNLKRIVIPKGNLDKFKSKLENEYHHLLVEE